jgi:hypothetical protein
MDPLDMSGDGLEIAIDIDAVALLERLQSVSEVVDGGSDGDGGDGGGD